MKLLKTFVTGAAMLSTVVAANADTTFHITGSTAFRAATITAIEQVLTGASTDTSTAKDNAALTSANNVLWTGSNGTYGNYVIKTSFNGSGAGVQLVSGTLAIPFLSSTSSGVVATPTPTNTDDTSVPDVAMSDAFQSATGFQGVVQTFLPLGTNQGASGTKQAHTYQTLTDNKVAIVTFKPMASYNFPQGTGSTYVDVTGTFNVSSYSMNHQNFSSVWNNGLASLALFTGNNADEASGVYATGRNPDSGTRVTYLTESGYGVNTLVVQSFPTVTSGTITAVNYYPVATINGISTKLAGNSGESSGSAVRGYLGKPFDPSLSYYNVAGLGNSGSAYYVTVLGTADCVSIRTAGIEPPWNGVYFNDTAVEEGAYTLWGYEHMYYANGLATSNPNGKTFADAVKTNFANNQTETDLSNAGLGTSLMKVGRTLDGGAVTTNY